MRPVIHIHTPAKPRTVPKTFVVLPAPTPVIAPVPTTAPKIKVNPLPTPHPHKGIAQEISDRLHELQSRFVKGSRLYKITTESLALLAMLVKQHSSL